MYPLTTRDGFDARYVHYFTLSDLFTRQAISHQERTGIPKLNREQLNQILILKPPLFEQRAIGTVLLKLQSVMAIQDAIVAQLGELKAATMAKLFREGLRGEPLKQTEIGEIPASWAVSRFGDFATLQRGYDLPVHERHSGTIPVVGSNGIVGSHSTPAVKGPGVITGRSGTIGLSFFSEQDFWPLNTALFVSDFHGNVPLFAQYLFENFDFRRYSAGVSVPTLNRNLVHQALLAVPPISEQAKIADILRRLDSAFDHATNRRDALKNLFSSMLHQLMTGRVRVTAEMIARERLRARSSTVKKGSGALDEGKVQEIVRRIVEAVAPEKIILFGSAARGEMGRDSDIDLLVVKACDGPREMERRIYRKLIGIGIPKDIVVVTPGHLEKHKDTIGYIYRSALREGRIVYAR
jgi:type I restriction enzyme S subunit